MYIVDLRRKSHSEISGNLNSALILLVNPNVGFSVFNKQIFAFEHQDN